MQSNILKHIYHVQHMRVLTSTIEQPPLPQALTSILPITLKLIYGGPKGVPMFCSTYHIFNS